MFIKRSLQKVAAQLVEQDAGSKSKIANWIAELRACGSTKNLDRGKEIHAEAAAKGKDSSIYVATTLVSMYAKCGSMVYAHRVFDSILRPSVVSWNVLIVGYAENKQGLTALGLFAAMKSQGCEPNSFTFIAALKACTSLALNQEGNGKAECLKRGKELHSEMICQLVDLGIHVRSALVYMYSKSGSMLDAREVFDGIKNPDVVSWNTLIMGYAENGEGVTALSLFTSMRFQGFVPTSITFVAALKACTSLPPEECLQRGKQIHSEIGCHLNTYVRNTLIDMYGKCGSMEHAQQVFNSMKQRDDVSWNALILGYARNGEALKTLDLFASMKSQGCPPDRITFVAVLKACGLLGALESGGKIHAEIDAASLHSLLVVTSLVDFYSKCGHVVEAQEIFDLHPRTRDLATWNALMAGYSHLGDDGAVFDLFKRMQDAGFQPDGVTFLSILTCCSHAGLVEKASEHFEAMVTSFGVTRNVEHFNCMVDILGRSNKLDGVMALLRCMPCIPDGVSWRIVLGACRKWKNLQIGTLAFRSLVDLNDKNASTYVFMAHIYGSKNMWEEQEVVRRMTNLFKASGQSCWTDGKGEVHVFLVGRNDNHPQFDKIQKKLEAMVSKMRELA